MSAETPTLAGGSGIVGYTPPSFSTWDVVRRTGLSYRRIDYWTRQSVIVPSIQSATGSGTRRRWSELDMLRFETLADVARAFAHIGVAQLNLPLVQELWHRLRLEPDMVIAEYGTVRLVVSLPELSE